MGCCGNNSKGCANGCGGHCEEQGLNSVIELEVYYSVSDDTKEQEIIFERLFYITNTQIRQQKLTGLEGGSYESLVEIKQQIFDYLKYPGNFDYQLDKDVEVIFIGEDNC